MGGNALGVELQLAGGGVDAPFQNAADLIGGHARHLDGAFGGTQFLHGDGQILNDILYARLIAGAEQFLSLIHI